MNTELTELARRAVACVPLKDWPDGTLYLQQGMYFRTHGSPPPETEGECLPDLNDAATIGCLERIVLNLGSGEILQLRCGLSPKMSGLHAFCWSVVEFNGRAGRVFESNASMRGEFESRQGVARATALVAALEAGSR